MLTTIVWMLVGALFASGALVGILLWEGKAASARQLARAQAAYEQRAAERRIQQVTNAALQEMLRVARRSQ